MQKNFFSHDKTFFFFKNWNLLKKTFFFENQELTACVCLGIVDELQVKFFETSLYV